MKLRTSPDFQVNRFAICITIRFSDKKRNAQIFLLNVKMSLLFRMEEHDNLISLKAIGRLDADADKPLY